MANPPQNPLPDNAAKPPRRPRTPALPTASSTPDAPLLHATDAGPRPLSERQQRTRQAGERPGGRVIDVPPARPPYAMSDPAAQVQKPRRKQTTVRDADTTHIRRVRQSETSSGRINRRRTNYPRLLLGWATATLVVEAAAALLWSPRFWVKVVRVEGNTTVPTARILARLHIGPADNVVRLSTGKLQQSVEAEPSVEWAEVRRTASPLGVYVFVRERTPWASVQVGGKCYTIDHNLVPFRVRQTPEARLPRLVLSGAGGGNMTTAAPVLGKPMTAPGLSDVSRCLAWSASQPDFPLESVEIDPKGKLCLNKVGGLPVKLGSGVDLDKKLQTLGSLLASRPELRESDGVAEINLFAFDAPAVSWRVASASPSAHSPLVPLSQMPAANPAAGGEIVP